MGYGIPDRSSEFGSHAGGPLNVLMSWSSANTGIRASECSVEDETRIAIPALVAEDSVKRGRVVDTCLMRKG